MWVLWRGLTLLPLWCVLVYYGVCGEDHTVSVPVRGSVQDEETERDQPNTPGMAAMATTTAAV